MTASLRFRLWVWLETPAAGRSPWCTPAYAALWLSCGIAPHRWCSDGHSKPGGTDWECLYCGAQRRTTGGSDALPVGRRMAKRAAAGTLAIAVCLTGGAALAAAGAQQAGAPWWWPW